MYKFTDSLFLYFFGSTIISNDFYLIDSVYWFDKTIGGDIRDCPRVYYICG